MNEFTIITVVISIIIAVIALNYNRRTYKKDYVDKPSGDLTHLLAMFKATQKQSYTVYNQLYEYTKKHDCYNLDFIQGVSYGQYLYAMKQSQDENLSDELYKKLKNTKDLPALTIQSMSNSLDKQLAELNTINALYKTMV